MGQQKQAEQLTIDQRDGMYYLAGVMNEFASLGTLQEGPSPVKINLKGISRFNSIGIRNLLRLIGQLGDRPVEYYEAPSEFIDQVNMIPALLGKNGGTGTIRSFFIPFYCESCSNELEKVVETAAVVDDVRDDRLPVHSCPKCGNSMGVVYDEFFLFLRRA